MGEKVGVSSVIAGLATIVRLHEGNRDPLVVALLEQAEQARAAIAELIEAGENVLQDLPRTTTAGPPDMVRRVLRFRAALENIGGAK